MNCSRKRGSYRTLVVLLASAGLVAGACGSDSTTKTTTAPVVEQTTAPTAEGTIAATTAVTTPQTAGSVATPSTDVLAGSADCPVIDSSLDKDHGTGAGRFLSDLECAQKAPLKAEGDPIVIGVQNPEGDPTGSFPEYRFGVQSAAEYINNELGGLGSDIQNGTPGRPIKLEICSTAITPDDSQRCANELVAKRPTLVYSTLNFVGNQFPIYAAANIPVIVGNPQTVADFTSPNVYAVGAGGGCVGVLTALVKFATQNLEANRVAIPWADTPPGVVCYYDLEAKPLDVLSGKVTGSSPLAGSRPDLEYIGVPIKPATPDVTPQLTQIVQFEPEAIIFAGQSADCWNLVGGLTRLGWTAKTTSTVFGSSCVDFDALKAAGDAAIGMYFAGSSGTNLNPPDTLTDPLAKFEAQTYQSKPTQYGMPDDQLKRGFAVAGWNGIMSLWERAGDVVRSDEEITGETLAAKYKSSDGIHMFGSTPLACAKAPEPYVAICNSTISITQWDGENLNTVVSPFSGVDLVAGTEIRPGP